MSENMKNVQCVTSLAVFRELYNRQRNVYDVIAEFAKTIIVSKALKSFELQQMCGYLNCEYSLVLTSAVVKTALKKVSYLTRTGQNYVVNETFRIEEAMEFQHKSIDANNCVNEILFEFVQFVKEHGKSDVNEKNLKEEFCAYLLDESVDIESSKYISAYIVSHQDDERFRRSLSIIREGLIIYHGLSYSVDANAVEKFDRPLVIFLETELLFHAVGYNGVLYKTLFDDLFKLITEINQNSLRTTQKKVIKLAYFKETEKEISLYFSQAEMIAKGEMVLDRSKIAMTAIVNGCQSAADVKTRESSFWAQIKGFNISLDDTIFDVTKPMYQKYNLTPSILKYETKDIKHNAKVYDITQMLSKVNYLRRNCDPKFFKTIGAILLSGNRLTFELSASNTIDTDVPLALSVSYLINRLWFSLNKGIFSNNDSMISTQVITLAKMSFSQEYNVSLLNEYKKVYNSFIKKEITLDEANRQIADLKVDFIKPENVTKEFIDDNSCFAVLNCNAVDRAVAEREIEKQSHENEKREYEEKMQKQGDILRLLLEEKNKNAYDDYISERTQYQDRRNKYVRRKMREKWWFSFSLEFIYVCIAVVSIVLSYKCTTNVNIFRGVVFISIAIPVIMQVLQGWLNPIVYKNMFFLLNRKIRIQYIRKIVGEYAKNHPKPHIKIYTVEDYV
mgnify:CR=1 FL=1